MTNLARVVALELMAVPLSPRARELCREIIADRQASQEHAVRARRLLQEHTNHMHEKHNKADTLK